MTGLRAIYDNNIESSNLASIRNAEVILKSSK